MTLSGDPDGPLFRGVEGPSRIDSGPSALSSVADRLEAICGNACGERGGPAAPSRGSRAIAGPPGPLPEMVGIRHGRRLESAKKGVVSVAVGSQLKM